MLTISRVFIVALGRRDSCIRQGNDDSRILFVVIQRNADKAPESEGEVVIEVRRGLPWWPQWYRNPPASRRREA